MNTSVFKLAFKVGLGMELGMFAAKVIENITVRVLDTISDRLDKVCEKNEETAEG